MYGRIQNLQTEQACNSSFIKEFSFQGQAHESKETKQLQLHRTTNNYLWDWELYIGTPALLLNYFTDSFISIHM